MTKMSDELGFLPFELGLVDGLKAYARRIRQWVIIVVLNLCALTVLYAATKYPLYFATLAAVALLLGLGIFAIQRFAVFGRTRRVTLDFAMEANLMLFARALPYTRNIRSWYKPTNWKRITVLKLVALLRRALRQRRAKIRREFELELIAELKAMGVIVGRDKEGNLVVKKFPREL